MSSPKADPVTFSTPIRCRPRGLAGEPRPTADDADAVGWAGRNAQCRCRRRRRGRPHPCRRKLVVAVQFCSVSPPSVTTRLSATAVPIFVTMISLHQTCAHRRAARVRAKAPTGEIGRPGHENFHLPDAGELGDLPHPCGRIADAGFNPMSSRAPFDFTGNIVAGDESDLAQRSIGEDTK